MKKAILFPALLATVSAGAQNPVDAVVPVTTRNKPVMDLYATAPRPLTGAGVGIGVYCPALKLPFLTGGGTEVRVGGDFHFTGLDRKILRDVPLLAPQTGNARVRLNETFLAFNAVVRVSSSWSDIVSPYVEGFAGLRINTAGIVVTPNEYQVGYEKTTSDNLDAAYGFQYGAAGGLMIALNRDIKLNAGVLYSRADRPGALDNIRTASISGTNILMDKKPLDRGMVIFRLGVTFRIDPSDERGKRCGCCGNEASRNSSVSSGGAGGASNKVGIGTRVTK